MNAFTDYKRPPGVKILDIFVASLQGDRSPNGNTRYYKILYSFLLSSVFIKWIKHSVSLKTPDFEFFLNNFFYK